MNDPNANLEYPYAIKPRHDAKNIKSLENGFITQEIIDIVSIYKL